MECHPQYYLFGDENVLKLQQQQNGNVEGWRGGTEGGETPSVRACHECRQLRKEVQELRQVQSVMYQLMMQGHMGSQDQTTPLNGTLAQGARKRPAPLSATNEGPPLIRPLPTSSLPMPFPSNSWLNWPGLNGLRPPSQTAVQTPAEQSTSEPVAEKWSSPSSVESNGQKTEASAESANIDIVGDGSESTTSSTSTQAMVTSPVQPFQQQLNQFLSKPSDLIHHCFPYSLQKLHGDLGRGSVPVSQALGQNGSVERKHRKPVNDDYVKQIRDQDLSDERISKIEIPVPEAFVHDPTFRPVPEAQIIQQIQQSKKYEDTQVKESMVQLCKKLAEKRVFGSKLMCNTTVAGQNHSNYDNLPKEGIIYIQHVCRKVMGDKFNREEDFWDCFRDAMKKLAARCRRVRHAKKLKNKQEDNGDAKREASPDTPPMVALPPLPETKPLAGINAADRSAAEALSSLSRIEHVSQIAGLLNNDLSTSMNQVLQDQKPWTLLGLGHSTESLFREAPCLLPPPDALAQ